MLISKMAAEGGGKEMNEIKSQFTTREGVYKLLTHSEYSRPNRVPFNSQGSNPVKVSFVNVNDQSGNGDRVCFNVGRELYFYIYKGVRKAVDLSKPIDKRIYKGTQPTCHDFNHLTATAESVSLLVGFSAGQVQLIDPIKKETSKLFNEEVSIILGLQYGLHDSPGLLFDITSRLDYRGFCCFEYISAAVSAQFPMLIKT
ncbi:UNVERIFIED_CONTAM: hypothetical protein FKN15_034042 [Acipenser sinensis]